MKITELSRPVTAAPAPGPLVLVELPTGYIPYLVLGLQPYYLRFLWASDEDYSTGYNQIADVQERLLTDMSEPIVNAIDRVYMALRQASTGEEFIADGEGAPPVLPPVPPELDPSYAGGVLGQMLAARGVLPGGWFGLGARPPTLADLVQAVRAGEPSELDMLLDKIDLLGDASDAAAIFNAVKGTASDLAELATGGGTLATLVVAVLASAATAGLAAAQMDSLITKVDRLIEQLGVPAAPAPEITVAGELGSIRGLLSPDEGGS